MSENDIKIEKGVPIPARRRMQSKYPVDQMQIGDSFLVPIASSEGNAYARARNAVRAAFKKLGWEHTTRSEEGGLRVWRTK